MKGIPVLMYHALEDVDHPAEAKNLGEHLYVLQVSQFREQLQFLQQEGFRTFLLDEMRHLVVWPEKSLIITFDDGHLSNYSLALPLLQEFGFKAEFFITTGWIDMPNHMNRSQIRELADAGMGIGSHGVSHRYFQQMTAAEMREELVQSKETLEDITGQAIDSFSAPGGRFAPGLTAIAAQTGYRYIGSSRPGYYTGGDETIPRFDLTAKNHRSLPNIIHRQRGHLYRLALRYTTLRFVKNILGNSMYERMRNNLLRES